MIRKRNKFMENKRKENQVRKNTCQNDTGLRHSHADQWNEEECHSANQLEDVS